MLCLSLYQSSDKPFVGSLRGVKQQFYRIGISCHSTEPILRGIV